MAADNGALTLSTLFFLLPYDYMPAFGACQLFSAGFYPADAPRYTITVLQDSQQKPQTSSATLFAQVADALAVLDAAITEKPAENS